jgi:hypothetical protein
MTAEPTEPTTPQPVPPRRMLQAVTTAVTLLVNALAALHYLGLLPSDHQPAEPARTVVIVCPGQPEPIWLESGEEGGAPAIGQRTRAAGPVGRPTASCE